MLLLFNLQNPSVRKWPIIWVGFRNRWIILRFIAFAFGYAGYWQCWSLKENYARKKGVNGKWNLVTSDKIWPLPENLSYVKLENQIVWYSSYWKFCLVDSKACTLGFYDGTNLDEPTEKRIKEC
jgi:hypothetical protein